MYGCLAIAPTKIMAATSMAAALAASLPAPTAAPAPAAPTYEAIPPSMAKVIDIEAEIPLQVVQLDGLVSSIGLRFL
jgi:translation initiation factor 3 subunit H